MLERILTFLGAAILVLLLASLALGLAGMCVLLVVWIIAGLEAL